MGTEALVSERDDGYAPCATVAAPGAAHSTGINENLAGANDRPRVSPDRLRELIRRIYESEGVSQQDATLIADSLVQAELWGHPSHGVLRVAWYYARLRSGAMKAVTAPETAVDAGAVAVLDGKDGVGQVIASHAVEQAVARARKHGVAAVSIRNSNHFGTCMYFTAKAARQGCIAVLTTNAGPNMPPWGGLKKMMGTNPWSIAAPAGRFAPMMMDVATSGVARGKIYLAQQRREKIPETWALDVQGYPTTDAQAALEGFILPMAGHKGYAMGVAFDVLSGVLSGSGFLDDVHGPYDPVSRSRAGHLLIALNIDAFQPRAQFEAAMESYIERLKSVPVAPGHEGVFYPGELEAAHDLKKRVQGLTLPSDTLAGLADVARMAGISNVAVDL